MTKQEHIEYLGQLALALQKEKDFEWEQYVKNVSQSFIQERINSGITWYPLQVIEEGIGLGSYPFLIIKRHKGPARHKFKTGQPVSFFSESEGNRNETLIGRTAWVSENEMKVNFKTDDIPDWMSEGKIGVNAAFDEKAFMEMMKALNFVINDEKSNISFLRDAVCKPDFEFETFSEFENTTLNEFQNEAVKAMLSNSPWTIIHGPPGTGKTTTLVEGILELARTGQKILVCAPTNAAVDHLVECLSLKTNSIIRIGNPEKLNSKALSFSLDVKSTTHSQFPQVKEWKRKAIELRKLALKYKRSFGKEEAEQRKLILKEAKSMLMEAKNTEEYILGNLIDQASIVCTTLVGSSSEMLQNIQFNVCVVDEAGQALEPATWIPVSKSKRLILAGDPMQLPATVFSQEATRLGLNISLMERLIKMGKKTHLLNTQYRMNEAISAYSNSCFYEGKLLAHEKNAHWLIHSNIAPLQFIDTAGTGYNETSGDSGGSVKNEGEAMLILKLLEELQLSCEIQNLSISVISPYRGQVEKLSQVLSEWNVQVDTIDSFQGQESDVVFISLVRSNDNGEVGFLSDVRRLNVAMTRARKCLRVIGDSSTISNHNFYAQFVDYCEKNNAYQSAWSYLN
ncbi:MAG: IGHMBP2 family helicase [Bacteroidetes bacterium]|nr:IGHMBP2 family helicase [Bacteroidota bacterium]